MKWDAHFSSPQKQRKVKQERRASVEPWSSRNVLKGCPKIIREVMVVVELAVERWRGEESTSFSLIEQFLFCPFCAVPAVRIYFKYFNSMEYESLCTKISATRLYSCIGCSGGGDDRFGRGLMDGWKSCVLFQADFWFNQVNVDPVLVTPTVISHCQRPPSLVNCQMKQLIHAHLWCTLINTLFIGLRIRMTLINY